MKKIFITLTLFLAAPVFAAVELDTDRNGATDISRGGTNSTTISGAKANLGIPSTLSALAGDTTHRVVTDAQIGIWDSKQPALTAGTDYLTPNGSAAGLVDFPATLATDSEVAASVADKESSLGNPTTSGWCLQSTDGGVRSWGVCGGLADATVDSKTYGRKDSAWVEVLNSSDLINLDVSLPLLYDNGSLSIIPGSYQAPLVSESNIKSLTIDGSTVSLLGPGTINVGGSSGGTEPTNITTDPTAASANGWYRNTTSGHWWYVDGYGLSDVSAGAYTPWDTTPAAFGFGSITGAVAGQTYCYSPVTITAIDRTAPVTRDTATYKINSGAEVSTDGVVALNNTLSPCLVASSVPNQTVTGNLTVGGVAGNPPFTLTTASGCDDGILVDGCFANGTTDWNTAYGAVISDITATTVKISTGNGVIGAHVETPIVAGQTYNYRYEIPAGNSYRCKLYIGNTVAVNVIAAGVYTGTVIATNTSAPQIKVDSATSTASCQVGLPIKVW